MSAQGFRIEKPSEGPEEKLLPIAEPLRKPVLFWPLVVLSFLFSLSSIGLAIAAFTQSSGKL